MVALNWLKCRIHERASATHCLLNFSCWQAAAEATKAEAHLQSLLQREREVWHYLSQPNVSLCFCFDSIVLYSLLRLPSLLCTAGGSRSRAAAQTGGGSAGPLSSIWRLFFIVSCYVHDCLSPITFALLTQSSIFMLVSLVNVYFRRQFLRLRKSYMWKSWSLQLRRR